MTTDEAAGAIPEVDFDHHSDEYRSRGMEMLAELRNQCPVVHTKRYGPHYIVTAHELVSKAASDFRTYSSKHLLDDPRFPGVNVPGTNAVFAIGETDPPEHTASRKVFNKFFSQEAAAEKAPSLRRWARIAIDSAIESGAMDLVNEYANAVSALFACDLLSLVHAEWRSWAEPAHNRPSLKPGTPEYEAAAQAFADMVRRTAEHAKTLRESPNDSLLSAVAQMRGEDGEYLDDTAMRGVCTTLIVGGFDTNTALVSNILWHLELRPDLRRRLIDEPDLIDSAIDEYLRYFTPAQGLGRTVLRPTSLGPVELEEFDRVFLSWAGANRDPNQFPDPDEVLLDRSPNLHLAFGFGVHRCIGRHFAKMFAVETVSEFLHRIPDYRIDHARAEKFPSVGVINGWLAMPATFPPGVPTQADRLP
jgi:cytochrome P450